MAPQVFHNNEFEISRGQPIPASAFPTSTSGGSPVRRALFLTARTGWIRLASWAWWANAGVLIVLLVWAILDPDFERCVNELYRGGISPPIGPNGFTSVTGALVEHSQRLPLLVGTLAVGLGSSLIVAASLFVGSLRQRSLLRWTMILVLSAVWCRVIVGWSGICWLGKEWRMANDIELLDPIAETLRSKWPAMDGESPQLGAFMAYPLDQPTVLLLLTPPRLRSGEVAISSVERGDHDTLRFELAGQERGDWLEWHPFGSSPRTFLGGLLDNHELVKSTPLGGHWHLARYRH